MLIKGLFSRKANQAAQFAIADKIGDQNLAASAELALERLRRGDYDFVDLGTCDGGGFTIAERQGGIHGLGFDLEPSAVKRAQSKGLDVILYDICNLVCDRTYVDFGVCSHILEHLPSLAHVSTVLKNLTRLCGKFLLISGPLFDHEEYLHSFGIKALQSLMLDHTCKMRLTELQAILHQIDCRDYTLALTEKIADSSNMWLHNALEPVPLDGLWTHDEKKHLPKPFVHFDRTIHRDFVCVVSLSGDVNRGEVLRRFYWGFDQIIVNSMWRFR